jgi:hypothetical protein
MNFYLENTPESMGAMAALSAKADAQAVPHFLDDPIDIRRTLIAKREAAGADTPYGHTCSNIVEILDGWLNYERPAWATRECQTLAWAMNQQIKRLVASSNQ